MKFPIGISDFKKLRNGQYNFVDKSLFIKAIMDNGAEVILLPRPRRFGKTLNMSMLSYFLQLDESGKDKALFNGLAIEKETEFCKEHQGQHPVIFVTFKNVKFSHYERAKEEFIKIISQLYSEHDYLLQSNQLKAEERQAFTELLTKQANDAALTDSLKLLAQIITKVTGTMPVILLDEYDTPIHASYINNYYDEMIEFTRALLGTVLKDNTGWLRKAVVTGITHVAQESIFSGLNNFEAHTVLDTTYGKYFGFSEQEVQTMLQASQVLCRLEDVKAWYNGYQVGSHTFYNPWSIINCLKNDGELKTYWLNTSDNALVRQLVSDSKLGVKKQFERLLQGEIIEQAISESLVFPNLHNDERALWSLLVYAGYLKILDKRLDNFGDWISTLAIPNSEVAVLFQDIVRNWFSQVLDLSNYDSFVRSLAAGDYERFGAFIQEYLVQTGSYFDFNKNTPEQVFHVFVLGLVVGLRQDYIIESNREYGFGRYDVAFIPKDHLKQQGREGIMLEFKSAKSDDNLEAEAQDALEQIKDKRYTELFVQHGVENYMRIGMAFYGKKVVLLKADKMQ